MNKTYLPDLTILFTCRIDSYERRANLTAALRYYRKYTDAPIMVMEADVKPQLAVLMAEEFKDVDYIFVEDSNPIFHRTHYINEQMRRLCTANSANIDVDTIVPATQLQLANELLRADTQLVMALPYDGRFICEGDYRSNLFRKDIDISIFEKQDGYSQLMFGFISVGGAYLVNVDRYRQCGWENEYFPGWGPEDYERFMRLDILGHKPQQVPGKIYHLNHPRGINSGDRVETIALATKREYCKVCSMLPNELRSYIASWPWVR